MSFWTRARSATSMSCVAFSASVLAGSPSSAMIFVLASASDSIFASAAIIPASEPPEDMSKKGYAPSPPNVPLAWITFARLKCTSVSLSVCAFGTCTSSTVSPSKCKVSAST